MAAALRWSAALLSLLPCVAGAQLLTLTNDEYGENLIPIGYPIPQPIESLSAIDGFRSEAALRARLADLALTHADISEQRVGTSRDGRAITAWRLGTSSALTPEGSTKPAALISGTIHAREWASPEVVVGLIERFAERADDGGVYRYLLDHLRLVVVPVLNPDGFAHTQRHAARTLQTEFPSDPQPAQQSANPPEYRNYPRDGRLRRKNLRDVDADTCPAVNADCMNGVDLNRNHTPFFGSGNQNSPDSRSLLHRGPQAESEPETTALYAAADLAPRSRLRFYVDVHSYGRVLFGVDTGNVRRDRITRELAPLMSAQTGAANRYPYDATAPGVGIGSTDEHFGNLQQIPAYTLEIEPRSGGTEYGGFGYHHDGFILPASQIGRVRIELADALVAGLYRMSGPPALVAAEIRRVDTGALVWRARWRVDGGSRRLQLERGESLIANVDYRLWLGFDKPMRRRDANGNAVALVGQSVAIAPAIAFEGTDASGASFRSDLGTTAQGWRATGNGAPDGRLRYADDAYAMDFRLAENAPLVGARSARLRVEARDMSGLALDADPATVTDWSAGWFGYEDAQGRGDTDSGGPDLNLQIVGADTIPPSGGGGGSLGGAASILALLMTMLRSASARTMRHPSSNRSV